MQDVNAKYEKSPTKIYNSNETGMGTVQEPGNILAPKGQKSVGSVTCSEHGKNSTLICFTNSACRFISPIIIFLRQIMSPVLPKDGPSVDIYACSKNVWSNEEPFMD
ncbi:hypothetical protein PR048_016384 [Dryococelus australis]|uniref:Uncharacterized protein n=1 Tax=Dryococelus australis TaxID=614101 RepID=A0ABQ9HJW4_9NEOP|nr:hypothetical protein PR048_016384 [Dryococelus australis]